MSADVAIVGAGVTGLSTAYHLKSRSPGLRVIVLEAATVGAGASRRSTGMVGPGVGQDVLALVRRVGSARAAAAYRSTVQAVAAVAELIAREQIDCDFTMSGQILWARSRAARTRLARQAEWLDANGLPGDALDDEALRDRIALPPSRAHGGIAALRLPVAGTLDPGKLVAGLASIARGRGARIFEQSLVRSVAEEARQVVLTLASGARVVADRAVIATAGYTPGLQRMRGRVFPLGLQVLATDPLPRELLDAIGWRGREAVVETRRIFNYFRLAADDRLIFGGGAPQPASADTAVEARVSAAALERLRRELHATLPHIVRGDVGVSHAWGGVIGYVLDGLPTIGSETSSGRVLHAVGWSGHGLALGIAAGGWLAAMIAGEAVPRADEGGLPWFRTAPPRLPLERAHRLAIRCVVTAMQCLDRIA